MWTYIYDPATQCCYKATMLLRPSGHISYKASKARKGKTMEIEIKIVQNAEERRKEIKKFSERAIAGRIENKHTLVLTSDLFAKIFSPKRIDLLMTLAKKESHNVTELAKKLGRKFEVVYRDLKLFEHFGLVKLVKEDKFIIPELIGHIRLPVIA